MKKSDHTDKYCPIARTLDILQDNWSILILRNAFLGARRFSEFQQQLGLTRHLLAARLKSFVAHGIMKKVAAREGGGREVYVLTRKGQELFPVIVTLAGWGAKWTLGDDAPPILYRHHDCGRMTQPVLGCSECKEPIVPQAVTAVASQTLRDRTQDADEKAVAAMLGYRPPSE